MLFEKTKLIYSYCVLRAAYCENEFEKTNPIFQGPNWRNILFERNLWHYTALRGTKKQTQFKANFIGANDGFVIPVKTGIQLR